MKKLLTLGVVAISAFTLSACINQDSNSSDNSNTEASGVSTETRVVTQTELAEKDGKNGNDCYVAVDGTVYQISGIAEWVNGIHTTTSGVTCGKDHTEKIKESPHGKSVLSLLTVVGTLE